jgi:hypothetical protein
MPGTVDLRPGFQCADAPRPHCAARSREFIRAVVFAGDRQRGDVSRWVAAVGSRSTMTAPEGSKRQIQALAGGVEGLHEENIT